MARISSITDESRIALQELTCEYVILKMAEWHYQDKKFTSLQEFNDSNTLGITKLMLYPFFTCIANGSFDLLYDLFSPFYAFEDGPTSKVSMKLLVTDSLKHFDLDKESSYNLKFKNTGSSWGEVENDLREQTLELVEGGSARFEQMVYDTQPEKLVYTSVLSSIKAINKQTNGKFISYNDYQVVTLARQHKSWSTIFNYYNKFPVSNLEDFQIPKEEASKDRKVYKSLEELEKETA